MRTKAISFSRISTAIVLTGLFLVSFGCSTEAPGEVMEDLQAIDVKSTNAAEATRAWKGRFTNAPDFDEPIIGCIPDVGFDLTTNIIDGNMTHLGKIQMGSFGRPQAGSCFLISGNQASAIYIVNYIGAHGDMITTEEHVTITVDFDADPTGFTGSFDNTIDSNGDKIPVRILSGTGRFENASGELYFKNAVFNPNPNGPGTVGSWELVGEITY